MIGWGFAFPIGFSLLFIGFLGFLLGHMLAVAVGFQDCL
jgi:hypothetical protein